MADVELAHIEAAQAGDAAALERMISEIQGRVYRLALRMLWHPQDAEDATQEILLRVVTHLSTFRGESRFTTWVYRLAANHLLNWKESRMEREKLTFDAFGQDLQERLSDPAKSPETEVLFQEVRVGCTLGMLLCLDRAHRITFILGDILELDGREAAEVLQIQQTAFRKRLERARAQIVEFMQEHCGMVRPTNRCRCSRKVEYALSIGRVKPEELLFVDREAAREFPSVLHNIRSLEEKQRAVALYRAQPNFAGPDFTRAVRELLASEG